MIVSCYTTEWKKLVKLQQVWWNCIFKFRKALIQHNRPLKITTKCGDTGKKWAEKKLVKWQLMWAWTTAECACTAAEWAWTAPKIWVKVIFDMSIMSDCQIDFA